MIPLTMDDLQTIESWIHLVVEPIKVPFTNTYTNYAEARNGRVSYTTKGFLINISPETLAKISSGELLELTI
jgi:hypothetical protein